MERKTPQEKKRLSYEKDRRNDYGENAKSSRKNIPRSKRIPNRANRRGARRSLASAVGEAETAPLEQVEAELKHRRPKRWEKSPDAPLGEMVQWRLERRARAGIISEEQAGEKQDRIRRRSA